MSLYDDTIRVVYNWKGCMEGIDYLRDHSFNGGECDCPPSGIMVSSGVVDAFGDYMNESDRSHLMDAKDGTILRTYSGTIYQLAGPRGFHDSWSTGSIFRLPKKEDEDRTNHRAGLDTAFTRALYFFRTGKLMQRISKELEDRIVDYARERGNRPRSFRDAVHEAVHAVEFSAPGDDWNREKIHFAMHDESGLEKFKGECNARAAEQIACERAGIEYDPEKWAGVSALEAIKTGVLNVKIDDWRKCIAAAYKDGRGERLLDQVIALVQGESG